MGTEKRRTKRRYASEIYPHAGEWELRPLSVEVPHRYAEMVGTTTWETGWFEAEQRNAATPWDRRAKSRRLCPHGKTRGYATEAEARTELVGTNIARNMGKAKRQECRVYECGACGRWHLTSKPRTTVRQVREP